MSRRAPSEWTIRKATIDDAAALSRCMVAAFTDPSAELGGDPLPPMVADYELEIREYLVWVAELGTEIVGGLVLVPKPEHMLIGIVGVAPKAQGLGLGKTLLDFAEIQTKRAGHTELRLATHIALTKNVYFYKRLGWTEAERDASRIYMSKLIG